ncbi:MAG TPA: hypothetical protein VH092_04755 [Urbifossiella sp.]|jgi:hypothetical protein|nr:hypothetical protein [Urbifossiella sp.]
MTGPARLDQLSDTDFITIWNTAGTTDGVVEQVVVRVGRVPRWAVMARAVLLRKAGNDLKTFEFPAPKTVTPSASDAPPSSPVSVA